MVVLDFHLLEQIPNLSKMKTRKDYRREWLERELIKDQRLKDIEASLEIEELSLDEKIISLAETKNAQPIIETTQPIDEIVSR